MIFEGQTENGYINAQSLLTFSRLAIPKYTCASRIILKKLVWEITSKKNQILQIWYNFATLKQTIKINVADGSM